MSLLKNILLVIISPNVGWEEIDHCGYATSRVLHGAFFPLLIVLAISCFAPMIYNSVDNTITSYLMTAIISVAMYFFTYFFMSYLLSGFYPELSKTKVSLARLNNYIIYNLIFLVLLFIIIKLLPGQFTPLYFLVLYVGYMAHRGSAYLGLPEAKQSKFSMISAVMLILMPVLIKELLQIMIVR